MTTTPRTITVKQEGRKKYAMQTLELSRDPLYSLQFHAENARMEHTGVHATITIGLNRNRLEADTFNIGRLDARIKLANAALKQLKATPAAGMITGEIMQHYLTSFCDQLWPAWVGKLRAEVMSGDVDQPPAQWMLRPFVLEQGITFLYGPQGRGKSYLLMLIAVALDAAGEDGLQTPWPLPGPRRVLYVNLERSGPSMRSRLGRINRVCGLPTERPMLFLNARGRSMADVIDAVQQDVIDHKVEVVLWDSVSRSGAGDLNNNETGNRIVDTLGSLGVAVVAIGHTPRADDNHMYGAVQFDQGADLMVQVRSQQAKSGDLSMKLIVEKGNDTQTGQSEAYVMKFTDAGLDSFGRMSDADLPAELQINRTMSTREAVLAALDQAWKEGEPWGSREIAETAEKKEATVRRELAALVQSGEVVKVGGGKGRNSSVKYKLREV